MYRIAIVPALLTLLALRSDMPRGAQDHVRTVVEVRRIVSDESSPMTALTSFYAFVATEDGVVYTAHTKEFTIRQFDASGKVVRLVGRSGQGPGEFMGVLTQLGLFGDTLWARDNGGRVTFWSREGALVRTVRIPATVGRAQCHVQAVFLGGRFIDLCTYSHNVAEKADSTLYLLVDAAGREQRRVLETRNTPFGLARVLELPGGWTTYQPFRPTVHVALAPNSSRVVVAAPPDVWQGRPGQVRLMIVESGGSLRHVDVSFPPTRFRRSDADTFVTRTAHSKIGAVPGVPPEKIEQGIRDKLFVPEYYNEALTMRVGSDGVIWIRPQYDLTLWRVLNDAGKVLFNVRVPAGLSIWQVSRAGFWASRDDGDGVPMILQYRVVP
jgi:hypothetical protein